MAEDENKTARRGSSFHEWSKQREKALADGVTIGIGITWGGYFANGEPVLKRISPSSVFNRKRDDEA